MRDPEIQALIDERNIYRVLARYCIGTDRRDPVVMKDCYWPEGVDDHGIMAALNAHEFVEKAVSGDIMKLLLRTLHILGQVSYDIQGDRARVESYVTCYQRVVNDPAAVERFFGKSYAEQHRGVDCDSHDILGGGRYLDIFEKRGDDWRILSRVATGEWKLVAPASRVLEQGLFRSAHGADADFLDPTAAA